MIVSLALFGYAAALSVLGRLLVQRPWTNRAPRAAIAIWQCLTASMVVAVIAGGAALLVPTVSFSANVAELLRACVVALRARYATPAGGITGAVGALLAAVVAVRVAAATVITVISTARWRRRHLAALTVLRSTAQYADACVLPQEQPLVYCLPGAHRRIVVTTGALRHLAPAELAAVLAHERAHLRQRHDLPLAWTAALIRAFPRTRTMRTAHGEVQRLVELLADDAATRTHDHLDLAAALLSLGVATSPRYALGATDSAAAQRVRRLIDPPKKMASAPTIGLYLVAAVMLALPLTTLVGPALASADAVYCPVHLEGDSSSISHTPLHR